MRENLGIPLEKHRKFAIALMELDLLAQTPPCPGKIGKLCDELRYELDEHVFAEFQDLPEQKRFDIYYPRRSEDFDPDNCQMCHVLDSLPAFISLLAEASPNSRAIKLAEELLDEINKADRRKKLPASTRPHSG